MYCPICGQQQVSEATRFCSRCGFLLTGVAQVVANNGNLPYVLPDSAQKISSMRTRGMKFGVAILLLGVILTPMSAVLLDGTRLEDYLVPLVALLTFLGGPLIIVFSAIFLSGAPRYSQTANTAIAGTNEKVNPLFQGARNFGALPAQPANFNSVNSAAAYHPPQSQNVPSVPCPDWREANTNELIMPPSSVTEDTTKLLDQEKPVA